MRSHFGHGRWLCVLFVSLIGFGTWTQASLGQEPIAPKSEPRFDVVVEKDVRVAARDGVKLALDLYLPAREGRPTREHIPALLARTPYNKNGMAAEGQWFAARGYA